MEIASTASSFFGRSSGAGSASGSGSGAKATEIFGTGTTDTIFAAGKEASATADQQSARAIIDAHRRDINRLRGYKVELTPTEKRRLVEIQEQVRKIEGRSLAGTVRQDEITDRRDLLQEADRIIGKPIVDVEVDDKLAEYNALKVAILEPQLDSPTAKRAAYFERLKATFEQEIADNPERRSLIPKFQTVVRQIDRLKPLKPTSQLSTAARRTYDDVVELINNHVGVKLELTARESDRVAALQASITRLQGSLGPDISQQPTAREVSRAYTSLALN